MSDTVQIALITGLVTILGLAVKEYFDRERLKLLNNKVDVVTAKADEIHVATNGLTKALGDAKLAQGTAEGIVTGRAEAKAEQVKPVQ